MLAKTWPWYIRFLLTFRRMQYEEVADGLWPWVVHYKVLFGTRYVYMCCPKPAEHVNCRCALKRRDER